MEREHVFPRGRPLPEERDKSAIGTLTGIAQFAGGIGCFVVNKASGTLFTFSAQKGAAFAFCGFDGKSAGYMVVFCYCAVAYLLAWGILKTLVRRSPALCAPNMVK